MRLFTSFLLLTLSTSACTFVVQETPTTTNRGEFSIDPRVVEQLTKTARPESCFALSAELVLDGRSVRPTEAEVAVAEHRCRGREGGAKLPPPIYRGTPFTIP